MWENELGFPIRLSKTMTTTLTIDSAGRVLLPKTLRNQLNLGPGDTLQLDAQGETVTLRSVRPRVLLAKEKGVWVYQGEPADVSIPDFIDRLRERRSMEITG